MPLPTAKFIISLLHCFFDATSHLPTLANSINGEPKGEIRWGPSVICLRDKGDLIEDTGMGHERGPHSLAQPSSYYKERNAQFWIGWR